MHICRSLSNNLFIRITKHQFHLIFFTFFFSDTDYSSANFVSCFGLFCHTKHGSGKSIPGCNSYFLCKYLKDIMLQARTYLFCAIRPEAKYLNYTFSTLGFAKNASVIKLSPKKATTAASPAERKLMQQLDAMKAMMEELKKQNEALQSGGGGGGGSGDGGARAKELEAKLAEQEKREAEMAEREAAAKTRQEELEAKLKMMETSGGGNTADVSELKAQLEKQAAEADAVCLTIHSSILCVPHTD